MFLFWCIIWCLVGFICDVVEDRRFEWGGVSFILQQEMYAHSFLGSVPLTMLGSVLLGPLHLLVMFWAWFADWD